MVNTPCATQLLTSADTSKITLERGDFLTPAGVRLAAATGRLRIAAVTPRGQRLFDREAVEAFLRARAQRRGLAA